MATICVFKNQKARRLNRSKPIYITENAVLKASTTHWANETWISAYSKAILAKNIKT